MRTNYVLPKVILSENSPVDGFQAYNRLKIINYKELLPLFIIFTVDKLEDTRNKIPVLKNSHSYHLGYNFQKKKKC